MELEETVVYFPLPYLGFLPIKRRTVFGQLFLRERE